MFCRKRCCRTIKEWEINIEELKSKVKQGAILIDVRSKQEYDEGHIQGAINIPEHEIQRIIEKAIPKKNQLIVLYCQTGHRSQSAYMIMKAKGYNNLYCLFGGLDRI